MDSIRAQLVPLGPSGISAASERGEVYDLLRHPWNGEVLRANSINASL